MNEVAIIYGSILVTFAIGVAIYVNYQERSEKDKKTHN